MSLDNPYIPNFGWKIDPDGRQDRGPGPVTVRKMSDEEKRKYGIAEKMEVEDMTTALNVDVNRMLEICREHGTNIEGVKAVAKEFKLTDKQASNQIYVKKIKRQLQDEITSVSEEDVVIQTNLTSVDADAISAINSHEDHPDQVSSGSLEFIEIEEYPDIKEIAKEVSVAINESVNDSVEKICLNASKEVDEMLELIPDTVNHPAHYTTGKIEVMDFIQEKLTPEEFEGFCKGVVLQYVSRCRLKGGIEDLKKARWYLERIIRAKETA
jgi:hypothetical protein